MRWKWLLRVMSLAWRCTKPSTMCLGSAPVIAQALSSHISCDATSMGTQFTGHTWPLFPHIPCFAQPYTHGLLATFTSWLLPALMLRMVFKCPKCLPIHTSIHPLLHPALPPSDNLSMHPSTYLHGFFPQSMHLSSHVEPLTVYAQLLFSFDS